jgi:hypothetical protein
MKISKEIVLSELSGTEAKNLKMLYDVLAEEAVNQGLGYLKKKEKF